MILWAIIIEIRKCNFLQEDRCLLDLHYSPFPNKRAAEHIKKKIPYKRSADHINEIFPNKRSAEHTKKKFMH